MKCRSWKVWVAGLALVQLLVVAVDVVLLWPEPCEADRIAAIVELGMTWDQLMALGILIPNPFLPHDPSEPIDHRIYFSSDGSILFLTFGPAVADGHRQVIAKHTRLGAPELALTRLRRTLARALPFLGE